MIIEKPVSYLQSILLEEVPNELPSYLSR